jgi:hypothetical protein
MHDRTAARFNMDLLKYVTEFQYGGLGVVVFTLASYFSTPKFP